MNHPFKVGDIVYHPLHQAGKVVSLTGASADHLMVDYGRGGIYSHNLLLSFKPWAKADHARPTQDGYHLVQFKDYQRVYLGHYRADRTAQGKGPWLLVGPGGKPVGDYTYGSDDRNVKPIHFLGATIGDVFKTQ